MQTKKHSFYEAFTNTAVGFVISLTATFAVFPLVGMHATVKQNILVTLCFTVISIVRGYVIRRYFNNKKPIVVQNKDGIWLYCFECEIETRTKNINDCLACSQCNLTHINV